MPQVIRHSSAWLVSHSSMQLSMNKNPSMAYTLNMAMETVKWDFVVQLVILLDVQVSTSVKKICGVPAVVHIGVWSILPSVPAVLAPERQATYEFECTASSSPF
jgi:hypothetical protein